MDIEQRTKSEQTALDWSAKSGYPYFDTRDIDVATLDPVLDLAVLEAYQVIPLHKYSESSLEFGLTEKTNKAALPQLQAKIGKKQLTFKAVSEAGLNYVLRSLYLRTFAAPLSGEYEGFQKRLVAQAPKQAFGLIAQLAYLMRSSDIHIEPSANDVRIRFRIDGTLHPITTVGTESYKIFLSDLQTRAEIKWGSDTPQSGRISYRLVDAKTDVKTVNMRIETIPAFHGEEIVVRLFNTEPEYLNLENLGFSEGQMKLLQDYIVRENGMILTVGPTGSGKTSTLYGIVNKLNGPEIKIVTLEDPVEYDLPGISQIPIHTEDKESFMERLRAVMREDPNVIMIGEIRDIDTAKTALQAALTGHLVLSTFHAASSATAISRLMDMVGNNPLLSSSLHMIQAQRLVRRVCAGCLEEYEASEKISKLIRDTLSSEQQKAIKNPKILLKKGKGCNICHGIGYKGRIGIVEQLPITPGIETLMSTPDKTTAQNIEALAIEEGMVTLMQDGILKVLAGKTTIEEVLNIADV